MARGTFEFVLLWVLLYDNEPRRFRAQLPRIQERRGAPHLGANGDHCVSPDLEYATQLSGLKTEKLGCDVGRRIMVSWSSFGGA